MLLKVKKLVLMKYGKCRFEFIDDPIKIIAGWILSFKDKEMGLNIDIMINKKCEVLNSILLH